MLLNILSDIHTSCIYRETAAQPYPLPTFTAAAEIYIRKLRPITHLHVT